MGDETTILSLLFVTLNIILILVILCFFIYSILHEAPFIACNDKGLKIKIIEEYIFIPWIEIKKFYLDNPSNPKYILIDLYNSYFLDRLNLKKENFSKEENHYFNLNVIPIYSITTKNNMHYFVNSLNKKLQNE